ncbi:MAG: energy-coupling factor transporter transmembrane protein EcfT [Lactobacillaceae bacterium]|jgi:energy-coupling factor transport system permease protein|nr:energy-coupling factor transporter transmembrane protein EcfT [Lactobacillaceae bacterium]
MNNIFGRFVNTKSYVHNLDPRTKLVINFFFTIFLVFNNSFYQYLASTVLVLLAVFFSNLSLKTYLEGLKTIIFLIVFSFFLQVLFTHPNNANDTLIKFSIISISKTGFINALLVMYRFLLMVILTTVFTATTTSTQIAEAIRKVLLPLKKIHLPIESFSIMISIALRFVPILSDEFQEIMYAQKSRGLNLSTGSLLKRSKAFVPIFIPLIVQSFLKAENLADVMTVRGFNDPDKRTHFHQLKYRINDFLVYLLFLIYIILIILLNYAKL